MNARCQPLAWENRSLDLVPRASGLVGLGWELRMCLPSKLPFLMLPAQGSHFENQLCKQSRGQRLKKGESFFIFPSWGEMARLLFQWPAMTGGRAWVEATPSRYTIKQV